MPNTLNLSLTEELRSYVDSKCGDHNLYATPSEFMRALLREKKEKEDAARLRDGVLAGLSDIAHQRTYEYNGDIESLLDAFNADD